MDRVSKYKHKIYEAEFVLIELRDIDKLICCFSFHKKVREVYNDALTVIFDPTNIEWMINILGRELEIEDNELQVTYDNYLSE